jgi:hypothetical protein
MEVNMLYSRILIAGATAGLIVGAGCARTFAKLTPAPTAARVPGAGEAAAATAAGVQVTAHTQAWQWDPTDLDTKVTPILIELANNSDRAVIVRYNRISLTDDASNRLQASSTCGENDARGGARRTERRGLMGQ